VYFTGEITLHVAQTVNTEQLRNTTYARNMVCFRYIIVDTEHEGGDKDDDYDDDDNDDDDCNNKNNNTVRTAYRSVDCCDKL
jgi:hypothetical protein